MSAQEMSQEALQGLDNLFSGGSQAGNPATPVNTPKQEVPPDDVLAQKAATDTGILYRIGNRCIDLYPIRIRDWTDASKLIYVLSFESLADVAYLKALETLVDLVKIAARAETLPDQSVFEMLDDMTDQDYKNLKQILTKQNDIDMKRVMNDVSRITGRKNLATPTSQ